MPDINEILQRLSPGKFNATRAANLDLVRSEVCNSGLTRTLAIERASLTDGESDSRSVELAFASDVPVEHWFGILELSMKPGAMRDTRLKTGAPLLTDHVQEIDRMVGVVESFSIGKDGKARSLTRFAKDDRPERVYQMVLDGIIQNVSVGFVVHNLELLNEKEVRSGAIPMYRSDDWEPYEISLVCVPADIGVGVGREFQPTPPAQIPDPAIERAFSNTNTENIMTPEEIAAANAAAEAQRTAASAAPPAPSATAELITRTREIVAFAEVFGEGDLARTMLASSTAVTLDDVRTAIQAKRTPSTPIAPPPPENVQLARTIPRYGTLRNFTGQDAEERAFRFGQWFLAARGIGKAVEFCRANGIILTRTHQEGVNETGGFLVPEEFGNDLIDLREQFGVYRRNAKMVPMVSDTRSDPRRTGGLTAYFVNESDAITGSTKGWDRVSLTAKKLGVLARYSSEIAEDAVINMGDDLAGEIAYAFANKEDDCGFNGDGTDTYGGMQGILTKIKGLSGTIANIAGLTVATGTGYATTYGAAVLTDFEAVVGKLPVYADTPRAKWFMHKTFYWNVAKKLELAVGGVTGAEVQGAKQRQFLGYDVEFVQVMPKNPAVSQVCALLGDMNLSSSFGSRRDTSIAISEHSRFANDEIEIRGTERFDINNHDVGNQSGTAALRVPGPVVGLITAAS